MEGNGEKIRELQEKIKRWQDELDTVWKDKNTDAAEVERRNLRNLISNAKNEIDGLNGVKKEKAEDSIPYEPQDFLDHINDLKKEYEKRLEELKRHKNKLTEEAKIYESQKNGSYKDIYAEYIKQIKEIEKEEKDIQDKQKAVYGNEDAAIQKLTRGRIEAEKEIKNIKKQIRDKQIEIEDIQFGTKEAMEEIELSDGSKTQIPKILRLNKELDELNASLEKNEKLVQEFQKAINEVKGIEEKEEQSEYTSQQNQEYTKFFHGQGDVVENTRDDRRANDEYFGFEGNGPRNSETTKSRQKTQSQPTEPTPPPPQPSRTEPQPPPPPQPPRTEPQPPPPPPQPPRTEPQTPRKGGIPELIIDAASGKVTIEGEKIDLEDTLQDRKGRKEIFKAAKSILKDKGIEIPKNARFGFIRENYNPTVLKALVEATKHDKIDTKLLKKYFDYKDKDSEIKSIGELGFKYSVEGLDAHNLGNKQLRTLNRGLVSDGHEKGVKNLLLKQLAYKYIGVNPKGLPKPRTIEISSEQKEEIENARVEAVQNVRESRANAVEKQIKELEKDMKRTPYGLERQYIMSQIETLQHKVNYLNASTKEEESKELVEYRYAKYFEILKQIELTPDGSDEQKKLEIALQQAAIAYERASKSGTFDIQQLQASIDAKENKSARQKWLEDLKVEIKEKSGTREEKSARKSLSKLKKARNQIKYNDRKGKLTKVVAKARDKYKEIKAKISKDEGSERE